MKIFSPRLLFISLVILGLTACASRLTEDNLRKIQTGMSPDQVETILGKPTHAETSSLLGVKGTTYTYITARSEVKIIFVNDQVLSTSGDFN